MASTAYLAPDKFQSILKKELKSITATYENLILTSTKPQRAFWAQNIWFNPEIIEFDSISDAVKKLKARQRNWILYSSDFHRRAKLIEENLPHVSCKPLTFPQEMPKSKLGSWTLISKNELLAATDCSSLFPNGVVSFVENKTEPPSRAYLKLFEALTLLEKFPKTGDSCLDVGASPGGWTWVLDTLGAKILSVDRSELESSLMKKKNITFKKADAFSITPEDNKFDWIFSDVICYPEKLLSWCKEWIASEKVSNMICTIKFQGESSYEIAKEFASLPHSQVLHLFNNKHELTFFYSK
ncbi:MAG: hypothetical protein KBC84_05035 [Proteobacteria bacterium]|nr:hypothetical protein [Pseudomonadota bacterium]